MRSRSLRALMRSASRAMQRWLGTLDPAPAHGRRRAGAGVERVSRAPLGSETLARIGRGGPEAAAAARGSGEIVGTYRNAFGTRRYKLYIPGAYRGEPLPLIVMLHGCKQDPDDFAAGTRMNALAEEFGCLVLYPAQARSANAYYCWNWFAPENQQRDAGEPSLLAGIVRKVMRSYAVEPRRVYAMGMSAGGAMAVVLATAYADIFTAIGVHSALPHGCAHDANSAYAAMKRGAARKTVHPPLPRVPVIVFHGEDDDVVHPINGHRIIEQLLPPRADRMPDEPDVVMLANGRNCRVSVYRGTSGEPIAEHWRIENAGHAWSGGSPLGRYTDPLGPDASREMLRFFGLRSTATASPSLASVLS